MNLNAPKIKSTSCSPDLREWEPSTLGNLLREINHIRKGSDKEGSAILFRGQCNKSWLLDSTFLRDSITRLFGIKDYQKLPNSIRHQTSFHRVIASLLLLKFGTIWKPSKEALAREQTHNSSFAPLNPEMGA